MTGRDGVAEHPRMEGRKCGVGVVVAARVGTGAGCRGLGEAEEEAGMLRAALWAAVGALE